MRLKEKIAIITASTSGIGKASALLFAKEGAKVVVASRNEKAGNDIVREIKAQGGEGLFVKTDYTDASSIQNMVKQVTEKFGRIDILFNNAGYFGVSGTVVDLREEDWNNMIDSNLKSAFLVSKYVVPEMLRAGKGSIVNMASECAFVGAAGESAYCAAKAGVVLLTKAMALDYAAKGIRVNAVAPSNIETPMFSRYIESHTDNPAQLRSDVIKMMPMQRLGEPEEIASVVLFLASEESSYLTGTTIMADAGYTSQ